MSDHCRRCGEEYEDCRCFGRNPIQNRNYKEAIKQLEKRIKRLEEMIGDDR